MKVPWHFYTVRFLLGLAEAGFFPGVIVYLTHWFPSRDRARALAWFLIATPIAQIISPKLSDLLLKIGTDETIDGVIVHHPEVLGLEGWQWVYIAWGIPAVVLGVLVLFFLTDRPGQARWLEPDEREALEAELEREKALHHGRPAHDASARRCSNPKVLLLAAAYFFIVTGNYGVEFFLPRILEKWYEPEPRPADLAGDPAADRLAGRPALRRLELRPDRRSAGCTRRCRSTSGPSALGLTLLLDGPPLWLTVALFTVAMTGPEGVPARLLVAPQPVPDRGRRRRQHRPDQLGRQPRRVRRARRCSASVENRTGSFLPGILFLCVSMAISATIILCLGLGRRDRQARRPSPTPWPKPTLIEPV